MALIARPPVRSKPKSCQVGDLGSSYHPPSKFMTSVMPYTYPAPDSNAGDMDMSQSSYLPPYSSMPPHKSPSNRLGDGQDSTLSFKDHGDNSMMLRRSFSTPSVTPVPSSTTAAEQQSPVDAQGEKKRNKLGYHRTSIACSHCRRRKIRCIASPDIQNRCMNCIRLKKECSFYPVDQQPLVDGHPKPSSQTSGGSNLGTGSSSPALPNGSPGDMSSHQQPYPSIAVPTVPSMGTPTMQTSGNEYFSTEAKVPSNGFPSGIPYSMGDQSSASWMTTDANGNPISKSSDHNGTWRSYPVDSSMSGQFSPYSHTSSTSTTWPAGGSDHEASESMGWSNVPQAVRSMSFSSEALGSQPQSPYFPLSQSRPYERQPSTYSDVYSSAISVAIEGSAGTVMDPTGSISPGAVPTPGHVAWQQQLLPQQHLYSRRDNFGGWGYGESGQSHQM